MALSESMTLQQMLAYANSGVAASATRCPAARPKYVQALTQARIALTMPEYAQFAARLQVLNLLADADAACGASKPAAPGAPGAPPAPDDGKMPWWLWAGLALGGVMLLAGKKKKGKKRSKKRRSR
jgi:hypothetical protein